jgi:DNA ligase-1
MVLGNVTKGGVSLVTSKGQLNGGYQTDEKHFEQGKNLGRANETTPLQQAQSEATSKVNKLLDKGYKLWPTSMEETNSTVLRDWLEEQGRGTDASGNLKPMLAQKDLKKVVFPCAVQRKYDGIRCFVRITPDKVTLFSRNGKEFRYLGHIKRDLHAWFWNMDGVIDGELYSHTLSFQAIVSAVKREQALNKEIKLRIYDLVSFDDINCIQEERMENLKTEAVDLKISGKSEEVAFEFAKTYKAEDWDKVKKLFARFTAEGYEGAMLRLPEFPYEFGKRSHGLIKYKEFDEDEFQICGVDEATGRDEGTAVFILRDEAGVVFRARPMGTWEERADYLINKDKYIGKMGTVKYQGKSDTGVPRFPIFKTVRNYE